MCWWGWILGKMGCGRACMMLRCHCWGFKPPLTASHIHIGCIHSVLAPWDAVDGHMCTPLCCITCAVGGEFQWKWGMAKPVRCCWCHGWGCKPPLTASHIHIGCIQSVLAPWDAVSKTTYTWHFKSFFKTFLRRPDVPFLLFHENRNILEAVHYNVKLL